MKNGEIRKLASQNLKEKKLKGFLFSLLFNVIITVATVWILIIALKYLMLPYTMKYNIDKLEPKELIEKAYKDAEGHHWQYIRMNLNYFLKFLLVASYPLVYLYLSLNSSHNSVISDCEGRAILLTKFLFFILVFLLFIPTMVITSSYLNTKCIASCNEFYKAKV